jgi:hypothetical protein
MIRVVDIIGRNPKAVARLLGEPCQTEILKVSGQLNGTKSYYQEGQIGIVFIDNIADQISLVHREYIEEFIGLLGLEIKQNKVSYIGEIHSFNIYGLKKVTLYGGKDGKMRMLIIKTFTD